MNNLEKYKKDLYKLIQKGESLLIPFTLINYKLTKTFGKNFLDKNHVIAIA